MSDDDNTLPFPTSRVRVLESLIGITLIAQNLAQLTPTQETAADLVDGIRALQGLARNEDESREFAAMAAQIAASLDMLRQFGDAAATLASASGRAILTVELLPDPAAQ